MSVPAQGRYQAALTAINRTQAVINTAKERITTWAKGKYQAALTAINKTQTAINTAKTRITTWARSKYEAALTAANNTGTGISRAVSSIRSRVVNATFKAKVTMSNVVSGLGTVVSRIRNAVSNFTANVRTHFANADGNVFNSVRAFANGGITSMTGGGSDPRMRYAWENHTAQIAPAGAMRLWAEPETGGEDIFRCRLLSVPGLPPFFRMWLTGSATSCSSSTMVRSRRVVGTLRTATTITRSMFRRFGLTWLQRLQVMSCST